MKSVTGPKKKLTRLKGPVSIPVTTVIKDKRTKFHTTPIKLPIPNQAILHQSGPLRGNVKIIDNILKTRMVKRVEPSSS